MVNEIVHLHTHTDYSMLDGLSKIPLLVQRAKELKMPALAITDHGNLFGAIDFYEACTKEGIKPIIGYEAYVTALSRFDREGDNYHLTLLAENEVGYKNLIQLTTRSHLEGFYKKPRVDHELLEQYSEGIICLSGCASSEISEAIRVDNMAKADKLTEWYRHVFGDRFYMELQYHGLDFQTKIVEGVLELGHRFDVPFVATNDAHYILEDHAKVHELLLCIQTASTIDAPKMKMDSQQFFLKTYDQMSSLFGHVPGALSNTLKIADRCNLHISFDRLPLPTPPIPHNITLVDHFKQILYKGLLKRYGNPLPQNVVDRVKYELSVIQDNGYLEYFLLVYDFINYAREQKISVGVRGSVGGSIVAYGLYITDIDPLYYELSFERFLNPFRVSMPDCDVDVADERRYEVINYINKTYGSDNVSQIINFGTIKARSSIRDIARALNIPLEKADRWAKLIPAKKPNQDDTDLEWAIENITEFAQEAESDPDLKRVLEYGKVLEGARRQPGIHAAGIVISQNPLTDSVPLYTAPRMKDQITTQFSMNPLEKIGLLKMDILGLRTLSIIDRTLKLIGLDAEDIPIDDPVSFDLIGTGHTFGLFQLGESQQMRGLMKNDKPRTVEEVAALIALYRPGPMRFLESYVNRRHGREKVTYIHPSLEEAFSETYGIGIFQEQIIKLLQIVANFSPGKADEVRKVVGKKKIKEMALYKPEFIEGAAKNGIDENLAEKIWSVVDTFSGYGFNKSHSIAYAVLAVRTAWLKAHYPVEFMTAILSAERGDTDKVIEAIGECRRLDIEIMAPSINGSQAEFSINNGTIQYGLSAVKGLGDGVAEKIIEERTNGPYTGINDFIQRHNTKVANKRVLEALGKAGAFDEWVDRNTFVNNVDAIISYIQKRNRRIKAGKLDKFIEEDGDFNFVTMQPCTREQKLEWEKEVLGTYISENLLKIALERLGEDIRTIGSIDELEDENFIRTGGVITGVKELTTKKGDKMAKVTLMDVTGSIGITVFPFQYSQFKSLLVPDSILIVDGKVQIWEDMLSIIANRLTSPGLEDTIEQNIGEMIDLKLYITQAPTGNKEADNQIYKDIVGILKNHPGEDEVIYLIGDEFTGKKKFDIVVNKVRINSKLETELRNLSESLKVVTGV